MIIFAVIAGGAAAVLAAVFVVVVASIRRTDAQMSLRADDGVTGTLVRRLLGVYVRQPGHPAQRTGHGSGVVPCGRAGR